MGALVVVVAHSAWQVGGARVGRRYGSVGPFARQCLDEALRLAVGSERIRSGAISFSIRGALIYTLSII
jgi:hypothetical protein